MVPHSLEAAVHCRDAACNAAGHSADATGTWWGCSLKAEWMWQGAVGQWERSAVQLGGSRDAARRSVGSAGMQRDRAAPAQLLRELREGDAGGMQLGTARVQ